MRAKVGRVRVSGSLEAAVLPMPRVVRATELDQAVNTVTTSSGEGEDGVGAPDGSAPGDS